MRLATRLSAAVCVVVLGAVALASAASASPPANSSFTESYGAVMTGYCPFDVKVFTVASGTRIDFFDDSGTLIRRSIHQLNVDTFSANGKTLTSLPFIFNIQQFFDGNGNITYSLFNGVVEMIPLPDGSLFVSAGRWDSSVTRPGVGGHTLSPDEGNPGDVAAFCVALSP